MRMRTPGFWQDPHKLLMAKMAQRRGAAAVEFAFVLPIFLTLLLGMIEVGRGIMVKQILTNAAREGAREAVLDGATASDVQALVKNYLADSSVSGTTVSVSTDPKTATERQAISVTASVPVSSVSWVGVGKYFPTSMQLSATATMLKEAD